MKALLDSQHQGFEKLSRLKAGALFMEAGTGKTRLTKELIESIPGEKQIFWFTPFQTKANLRVELDKWGGLECEIHGTESLSNSDRLYLQLYRKISTSWNPVIIVDESLKIKNSDAVRTRRLLELGKMISYKLILNGTPISRNLLDLWTQIHFLSPRILNMSEVQFKNTFCEYVQLTYSSPGHGRSYTREFIKKYHNLEYLYSLIEPYVFESKLSISVGMQHINLNFYLSEEEIKEHNRIKNKYLDDEVLMARNNNIFLELTQKMQHNYSLSDDKFTIMDKMLEQEDLSKVLIYAKYIDTQAELKRRYPNIRIMSIGKHSYGLNLQQYNCIFLFDKTWDYAQLEQLEHRVHRTGQTSECRMYDFTSNAGLCKLMNDSISKKTNLLAAFKEMTIHEIKAAL